ncbi:MAG TPA: PAS domain-containing protein [Devosiaceae bacterium]|nr:PAS domain-containing protein [Devosiaceae bacterium]
MSASEPRNHLPAPSADGRKRRRLVSATQLLGGGVALALLTWICFQLQLSLATTAFIYLIVIVLASIGGSLAPPLVLSLAAFLALNYFFATPTFTFHIQFPQDEALLGGFFLLATLTVIALVRGARAQTAAALKAGAALQRAEAYLAESQRLSRTGSWAWDARNREITYWSTETYRLFGFDPDEDSWSFRAMQDRIHPEDRHRLAEIQERALLEKSDFEAEFRLVPPGGSARLVLCVGHLVVDANQNALEFVGTYIDITEQRAARAALTKAFDDLKQAEAYSTEAQRLSHTGSLGWQPASGKMLWSAETFAIFGYETTASVNIETIIERAHPDERALLKRIIDRASRDGGDVDHECRLLMPDGTHKHIHLVAHASRGESGNLEFAGAVMDITAGWKADAALREAQANLAHVTRVTSLGELTASIAHEVSQPLAAIVTNCEVSLQLLDRNGPDDMSEVRQMLNDIIGSGKRAGEIIRRVRALTRKTEIQKVVLDIGETVNEVIPLVNREVLGHRVSLRLDLMPGLPPVLGDRVQLQQVIINLLVNGMEAMATVTGRPRELVIRSGLDGGGQVLVAVADSGGGFAPETADQLFNPFFTTKPRGMGMGLSICRSIIEDHGGKLWASPNAGPGATFQFTLPTPMGRTDMTAAPAPVRAPSGPRTDPQPWQSD